MKAATAMTMVVAAALFACVAAVPQGFSAFFDAASCPDGWGELNVAQGRLIVSVSDPSLVGVTVNQPLADQEDRSHQHTFNAIVNVPQKDIAAIGCCNNQGAAHGDYPINNSTLASDSAYPFTQLLLCTFQGRNDTTPLAYGTVGFFDPDVGGCPSNWNPMVDASGRILVPGYEQGGSISNAAPALAPGEDRVHQHNFSISFPTNEVSYAGIDGCCNSGPAQQEDLTLASVAEPVSTGLPYVQLLTCVNQEPTFNQSLPADALAFSAISCPPGWDVVNEVSGRFLVALPSGAQPGASFGGSSVSESGKSNPAHAHDIVGSLDLPSTGVGLASGCCGGGYIGAGTYGFSGATSSDSDMLPYTLIPLCRSSLDTKSRRSTHLRKA